VGNNSTTKRLYGEKVKGQRFFKVKSERLSKLWRKEQETNLLKDIKKLTGKEQSTTSKINLQT